MNSQINTAVVLSAVLLPIHARAEGPFLSIPFAEACKKAEAEKKLVFLDFYTTWCGPCKLMDRETWKDPKVVEFLKTKVVALALDADKEISLAEKYRINSYPTLIFAKPDGSIVEVARGFHTADQFLGISGQVIAGKDSFSRLSAAVQKSPDDPVNRVQLADALITRGQYKEAMGHLVHILESTKVTPLSISVMPMAVYTLLNLSGQEADAEKTVQRLHASADKAVSERTAGDAQLALFASVHLVNNEPGKVLSRYDELVAKGGDEKFLERATRIWKGALIEEKRFDDVAKRVDVVAAVKELVAAAPPPPAASAPASGDPDAEQAEMVRQQLMMQVLDYYKALIATQRTEPAAEVAKEALRGDPSAAMHEALAWTGFLTGKPTEANLEQARKALELAGGKDVSKIDTLARILHALGKKDEAIKVIKDAQGWAPDGPEREMLSRCLNEISA